MSSCPLWRPDCAASSVVGGVVHTADNVVAIGRTVAGGVSTAASVVGAAAHGVGQIAGHLGGLLPLLLIVGITILIFKIVGVTRQVGVAVADGYSGGAASKATNVKEAAVAKARDKGQDVRRSRESSKGPQVSTHTGGGTEIVERYNDPLGRPARLVVCAASPGDASAALTARMHGHSMTPTGSKPCDLKAAGHRHFTFKRS